MGQLLITEEDIKKMLVKDSTRKEDKKMGTLLITDEDIENLSERDIELSAYEQDTEFSFMDNYRNNYNVWQKEANEFTYSDVAHANCRTAFIKDLKITNG